MEIVTTVPFSDDIPASARSFRPVLSEDRALMYVPFSGLDIGALSTVPGAHIAVVSTESDTIVNVDVDTRAPGGDAMFVHPQTGDFIYVGDALNGFAHHFGMPRDAAPALLRIKKGETSFDPDWIKTASELNSEAYGDIGGFGGVLALGDRFVVTLRDEDASPDPATFASNPFGYLSGSVLRVFAGSLDDWLATPVAGTEGQSVAFAGHNVEGRFVAPGANSKLYFVTDQNELEAFYCSGKCSGGASVAEDSTLNARSEAGLSPVFGDSNRSLDDAT